MKEIKNIVNEIIKNLRVYNIKGQRELLEIELQKAFEMGRKHQIELELQKAVKQEQPW